MQVGWVEGFARHWGRRWDGRHRCCVEKRRSEVIKTKSYHIQFVITQLPHSGGLVPDLYFPV